MFIFGIWSLWQNLLLTMICRSKEGKEVCPFFYSNDSNTSRHYELNAEKRTEKFSVWVDAHILMIEFT